MTYQHPSGNRVALGEPTDIHSMAPLDIPLKSTPSWLLSETYQNGVLWVAVLHDGTIQALKVVNGTFSERNIQPLKLPPGMPPLLLGSGETLRCWDPPADAATGSHGVVFRSDESVAYIDIEGHLVVPSLTGTHRLPVLALPDARILVDERERLLLLTGPTRRYPHGVLGDAIEAASFTIVDTKGEPDVVAKVSVDDNEVIEGTSLIWVDVNGDQEREIICTVAAPGLGARLRIYQESGEILAEGPVIGRSFRWRNQAAFFQDPQSSKWLLTDVLTPHIGGTLEFFEWTGQRLKLAGSHFGVTSHRIGSRNLDWALGGPFGLQGQFVMLQPHDARNHLVAVGMKEDATFLHWSLPLGGEIRTNLSSAQTPSGQVALGVGTSSNQLRIWQPEEKRAYLKVVGNEPGNPFLPIELFAHPDGIYQIQASSTVQDWLPAGEVVMQGENTAAFHFFPGDGASETSTFLRAVEMGESNFANVIKVEPHGEAGAFQLQVTVRSPDTGCDQYADWWEVLSETGDLIYRRILLHSHVSEQPFRRSGGPVSIPADQRIIVRAHMNGKGYGGLAQCGSPATGFVPCLLPPGFGNHLESVPPLPKGCAF